MASPERAAPTIIDVAQAAGVSKSLVSLAIRGDSGVAPGTRDRILAVAAELGYRSNVLARGLARGRTQVIGVLVSDLRNPYFAEVVTGIEAAAQSHGFGTVLGHGQASPEVLARRLDQMLDLGVDGVIVASAMLAPEALDAAASRRPLVMVGRPFTQPRRVSVVRNHDERGAAVAVGHLLALGHRRIAHLASSRRAAAAARQRAYADTLREASVAPETWWVEDGGAAEVIARIGASDGPTACFAGNDRAAVQLIHRALDAGLSLPQDLSVVGYDNSEIGRQSRPALTTVEQPREAMGREAMRLLLARIGGDVETVEVSLEPHLVRRESSAPPR